MLRRWQILGRGSKEGYTPRRVDAARADDGTLICGGGTGIDQIVGAAARLPDNERKDLAILALARSATIRSVHEYWPTCVLANSGPPPGFDVERDRARLNRSA